MQIYPTVVGLYPTGTYAERNERATAAQKAEDRKRLLEAVQGADLGRRSRSRICPPAIVRSPASRYTEVPSGDEYHARSESKEPNFD